MCRDAAAGRHDADGRDVPERHGHAAPLPIAARTRPRRPIAALTSSVDRAGPAARRPAPSEGRRSFSSNRYIRPLDRLCVLGSLLNTR